MIKINFSFISKNHSLSKIKALFFHNPEAGSFLNAYLYARNTEKFKNI